METLVERGIQVVKASEVAPGNSTGEGIRRIPVFAPGQYGPEQSQGQLNMGIVVTPPAHDTGWHHHGPHEIMAQVISGRSRFRWGKEGNGEAVLEAGDFFRIEPGAIHREETLGNENFVIVAARCGAPMTVVVDQPAN